MPWYSCVCIMPRITVLHVTLNVLGYTSFQALKLVTTKYTTPYITRQTCTFPKFSSTPHPSTPHPNPPLSTTISNSPSTTNMLKSGLHETLTHHEKK